MRCHGLHSPRNFPGQNIGVGSCSLLQGIFPTQGSNPGLSWCRWILYQLSHQESPRILKWVAYPFSVDLPDPGIELGSPALQVNSLLAELPGKTKVKWRCDNSLKVLVTHWCPTFGDPLDCSPPGSSVHEIFQVRIL